MGGAYSLQTQPKRLCEQGECVCVCVFYQKVDVLDTLSVVVYNTVHVCACVRVYVCVYTHNNACRCVSLCSTNLVDIQSTFK